MLISEVFLKDLKKLPTGYRLKVIEKLKIFESELQRYEGEIRKMNSGFWIIGLKNEVYKFRLNIKDRILFSFRENRNTGKRDVVQFLRYVKHDEQIRVAHNIDIDREFINVNEVEIHAKEDIVEKVYIENFSLEDTIGILLDDKQIIECLEKDEENHFYYLSDEQYEVVQSSSNRPLILKGAGGTGKTVVLLNKLLQLEKKYKKVVYITYTEFLAEKVSDTYMKFCSKENINGKSKFYTLTDLHNQDSIEIVKPYEVLEWIDKNKYRYKKIAKIESSEIFSELNGVLKGYLGIDGVNIERLKKEEIYTISLEEYLNILPKYSVFSIEQKKEMFNFIQKYNQWLQTINKKDFNDIAINILKYTNFQFDYIVIDEVQDFSELQLYMLSNLLKYKNNIVWAGDFHQTINPTFFEFYRLKNIYFSKTGLKPRELMLTKNFRSNEKIVKLFNEVAKYRRLRLGSREEYEEIGIREGEAPRFISPSEENLQKLLKMIVNKVYCAIIVSDYEDREKLIKLNPKIAGRVFTVFEMKGLEYKNIYCYNIISKQQNIWDEIFKGDAKNPQMRYYFNILYVALSRAREYLFLYENNLENIPKDFMNLEIIDEVTNEIIRSVKKSSIYEIDKEINTLNKLGNTKQSEILQLNNRLLAFEIEIVRTWLENNNGYGTLVKDDEEYVKRCINNNKIVVTDVLNDVELEVSQDKIICNKCLYSQYCILNKSTKLNILLLENINIDEDTLDLIEKIHLNMARSDEFYCAEILSRFKKMNEALKLYDKVISAGKEVVASYYCKKQIYELQGNKEEAMKAFIEFKNRLIT